MKKFEELNGFYHLTHVRHLESIFKHGLLSHNESHKRGFVKVDISNKEVNARRVKKEPIYGRSLHDYVPFYFNHKNAMLYKNRNDDEVVIIRIDKNIVFDKNKDYVISYRNASRGDAKFFDNISVLDKFDWNKIMSLYWSSFGIIDEDIKSAMMSEILIYPKVESRFIQRVVVKNEKVYEQCKKIVPDNVDVSIIPRAFFKG